VNQPEGIAVFQIGHGSRRRFWIAGEMLLDLDPPGGVELVVHVGEEIAFGEGIRHQILR
jgi:hypothetical protein